MTHSVGRPRSRRAPPALLTTPESIVDVTNRQPAAPRAPEPDNPVVNGQRLRQAVGDIVQGWQQRPEPDGVACELSVRELRDGSPVQQP
jgi:hypothetical protein